MSKQIQVGGQPRSIGDFNTRKVLMASRAVKEITRKVPDLTQRITAFRTKYREENTEVITQAMSLHPLYREMFADISIEEWEKAGGRIELPGNPSQDEILTAVFPEVMEIAEENVLDLVALVLVPNDQLSAARKESEEAVKKLVAETREDMLDDTRPGEFLEIVDAAVTELKDEITSRGEVLGRLRGLWQQWTERQTPSPTPDGDDSTDSEEETATTTPDEEPSDTSPGSSEPSSPPNPSTMSRPPSSGDSDPSDGTRTASSTEPVGAPSSASPGS